MQLQRLLKTAVAAGLAAGLTAGAAAQAEMLMVGAPDAPMPDGFTDSDKLKPKVEAGELPSIDQRLPKNPRIVGESDLLRFGDHRCTLRELLRDVDTSESVAAGASGRGRSEGTNGDRRAGPVERDPLTGEIVPKRV